MPRNTSPAKDWGKDRRELRNLCAASRPLIEALQAMYPPKMPALDASDRAIGAHIGQQQMIELLTLLLAESDANNGGAFRTLPTSTIVQNNL